MIPLYTPAAVREMDSRTTAGGTTPAVLMERAAAHLARAVLSVAPRRYGLRAVFVCGKGNNGGDGIAAARLLSGHGVDARVHLISGDSDLSDDAAAQLDRFADAGGRQAGEAVPEDAEVVVDCMLGTGATGPARGAVLAAIEAVQRGRSRNPCLQVIACDVPSGVDPDTGQVPGEAISADLTLTIGAAKRGLHLWPARQHCGTIRVADIGILDPQAPPAAAVMTDADAREALTPADPGGDKRSRGVVVVLAGSPGMAGAAVMAARGALAMGVGLLTLATAQEVAGAVAPTVPEAMTLGLADDPDEAFATIVDRLEGADALAIGPGLGHSQPTASLVKRLVREVDVPLVLDADGLNAFRGDGDELGHRRSADLVCTPHAREFARLLGRKLDEVWPERITIIDDIARRWRATVVLKGPGSIIQPPGLPAFVNSTGSAALATGGTGDVLTGMLAAALPHSSVPHAVAAAVHVHGRAGEIAAARSTPRSVAALDVAAAVPAALRSLEQRWT